ncbi:MAG: TetR family transcriptional regulator [Bdellovibrionaceae bacterium]|nr:TetR family transcriptional regulator [Pseudobdellovibrionaceae bacterium]
MAKKTKPSLKSPRRAAPVPEGAREKIVNVARRLFAEYGLEGVSVRHISKDAGLNVSLVSYYFGGKEGLYNTILEEHAREVQRALMSLLVPFRESDNLTKEAFHSVIESFVRNLVEMRLRTPEMSLIIQRERFSGLPYARKNHEEIFGPLSIEFDAFMKAAVRKKVVRANVPVVPYFISIVESIMGYFLFQECHTKVPGGYFELPQQKEQYIDFLTRLFTEGIYK